MEPVYYNFDLTIDETDEGYLTRLVEAPDGTGSARFILPLSEQDLDQLWGTVERRRELNPSEQRRIARVMGGDPASLQGKAALRQYWAAALAQAPSIYFTLDEILVASDAVTLLYTNHREERVAETFLFDEDGEVWLSIAAYN